MSAHVVMEHNGGIVNITQGHSVTRSNCILWALGKRIIAGGELHVRRSPDFPLLPRVCWTGDYGRTWWRFMHIERPRTDGWRRWLPLHCLWFKGRARRDFGAGRV
jgi:hypothetical protein